MIACQATLLFLVLLLSTLMVGGRAMDVAPLYDGYLQMMSLVNKARADRNVPPMCICRKLMESAKNQSDYQASVMLMTHGGPLPLFDRFRRAGFAAQAVAENVAWTSGSSIDRVVKLWINSPGHYANIMGNYTHFGSYVSIGADGKYYWTQHFARPWANAKEPCMSILGWGTTVNPAIPTVTPTPHSPPSHSNAITTITMASPASGRPPVTSPIIAHTSHSSAPIPTQATPTGPPSPSTVTTVITTVLTVVLTVY